MLLAILFCYLVSVLPFGITIPLIGILGRRFKTNFFDPMFLVYDLLALTNSVTVFVLLLSMSRLFRQTLYHIFSPRLCHRLPSVRTSTQETRTRSSITNQGQSQTSNLTAVVTFDSKATQTSQTSLTKIILEFDRMFHPDC